MMRRARRSTGCPQAACATLALLWCGLVRAQPLELAVSPTAMSLPLYVAASQGYFQDAGVDVHITPCLGGQRCIVDMLEGRAHLATATEMPVVMHSFKRQDFAIIASLATNNQDSRIMVRRSAGITTIAQLAGRRVATVKGASAHYHLDSALLFHGVDPHQVQVQGLPPEQVGPALLNGQVDAAVVWEPFAHQTLRALGADALALPNPRIYASTFNLVARKQTLAQHKPQLLRLLKALERAMGFIEQQPAQAQAVLKQRLGVDQAFVDVVWPDHRFRLGLAQPLLSTLEGQARWAVREGHVPAGSAVANMLDLVDTSPLLQAVPASVTLVR